MEVHKIPKRIGKLTSMIHKHLIILSVVLNIFISRIRISMKCSKNSKKASIPVLSTQAWFQPTPKKGIWGRYSSLVKLPIECVTHPECNKTHATKMGEKHQAILQAIFSRSPQNSNVCKATSATKQQGNNNKIPAISTTRHKPSRQLRSETIGN